VRSGCSTQKRTGDTSHRMSVFVTGVSPLPTMDAYFFAVASSVSLVLGLVGHVRSRSFSLLRVLHVSRSIAGRSCTTCTTCNATTSSICCADGARTYSSCWSICVYVPGTRDRRPCVRHRSYASLGFRDRSRVETLRHSCHDNDDNIPAV